MPKRIYYISLVLAVLSLISPALAQETKNKLESYIELYPEFDSERKDLLLEALSKREAIKSYPHTIYEDLQLLALDSLGVRVRTSKLSTWELRRLPLGAGQELLAVIETAEEPIADSQISFYDSSWHYVTGQSHFEPPTAAFLSSFVASEERARLVNLLQPLYLKYQLNAKGELELKVSVPTLLNDETRASDQALIQSLPTLRYQWQRGKYQLIK